MIPIFTSFYSIGRSILNVSEKIENKEGGPDNIISIALDNKLDELVFCETGLLGFLQIYNACKAHKIKMRFGYRVNFCSDLAAPRKEELHRNVIFLKKSAGYPNLVKLASIAGRNIFEGEHTLDYPTLHKHVDGLELVVPFYNSYLAQNTLSFAECVPDWKGLKPKHIIERNELPSDFVVEEEIKKHIEPPRLYLGKSIFYKDNKDVRAFQVRKLMENKKGGQRRTLERPNLENFTSDQFSFQSWLEHKNDQL